MNICVFGHFGHVHLFATPWTVACQAPLSVGVLQARIWSGLPSPPPPKQVRHPEKNKNKQSRVKGCW